MYRRLDPPPVGEALTIRHLFAGGGVQSPCSQADYIASVYAAWMARHAAIIEEWYQREVLED